MTEDSGDERADPTRNRATPLDGIDDGDISAAHALEPSSETGDDAAGAAGRSKKNGTCTKKSSKPVALCPSPHVLNIDEGDIAAAQELEAGDIASEVQVPGRTRKKKCDSGTVSKKQCLPI